MEVPTFASLWRVARSYKGRLDVLTEGSCYVHWNRKNCSKKRLRADYSISGLSIRMLLSRLIAGPATCSRCRYRRRLLSRRQENPRNSTLSINVEDVLTPASPPFPDKLFCTLNGHDVMVIPTGCMLIRLSVVKKLKPPYFRCERPIGEDVFFCSWLWSAGIKIWCDPFDQRWGILGRRFIEDEMKRELHFRQLNDSLSLEVAKRS